MEDVSERCVRCSEFPDIQIEGRSLSRILTNANILMAREHCEVLGPDACPDCVKVRSQKHHEDQCVRNTPSIPNEVYKIALVHERSPHLTIREVQRKLLDGEISDHVLHFPQWPQHPTHVIPAVKFEDENLHQKDFLPEIPSSKPRKTIPILRYSKSFINRNVPSFETIPEASEFPQNEDKINSLETDITETANVTSEMKFRKRSAEKMRKIQIVQASENSPSLQEPCSDKEKTRDGMKSSCYHKPELKSVATCPQKHEATIRTVSSARVQQRRSFTSNTVPSNNFFFDIADLAERLRTSGVPALKKQKKSTEGQEKFLQNLASAVSPPDMVTEGENKMETESVSSTKSSRTIGDVNMDYEPPVFFENRGRLLGLKTN